MVASLYRIRDKIRPDKPLVRIQTLPNATGAGELPHATFTQKVKETYF